MAAQLIRYCRDRFHGGETDSKKRGRQHFSCQAIRHGTSLPVAHKRRTPELQGEKFEGSGVNTPHPSYAAKQPDADRIAPYMAQI